MREDLVARHVADPTQYTGLFQLVGGNSICQALFPVVLFLN
jgi:hypothetical protein